jgi:hypothetical protein
MRLSRGYEKEIAEQSQQRPAGQKKTKEKRMNGQRKKTKNNNEKKPKCFVADNAKVLVWILNYKI